MTAQLHKKITQLQAFVILIFKTQPPDVSLWFSSVAARACGHMHMQVDEPGHWSSFINHDMFLTGCVVDQPCLVNDSVQRVPA